MSLSPCPEFGDHDVVEECITSMEMDKCSEMVGVYCGCCDEFHAETSQCRSDDFTDSDDGVCPDCGCIIDSSLGDYCDWCDDCCESCGERNTACVCEWSESDDDGLPCPVTMLK